MSPAPEQPPPPALPLAEISAAPPVHSRCENCGTPLAGPYCHQCGQHDFDVHRSFRHLLVEAVDALFNIEGRFFQSLIALLFRPGHLTAEFIAGKRICQMPPFRLYIFVSFLFFLVIFLDTPSDQFVHTGGKPYQGITVNGQPVGMGGGKPAAAAPAPPAEKLRLVDQIRATADEAKAQAVRNVDPKDRSAFEKELDGRLRRLNDPAYRQRLTEIIQANMPHMLMLCLPVFALYSRVLFCKARLMYLQHLVLALHFHTFIYLWIVLSKGWAALADLPGWGWGVGVMLACDIWLWIYPVLMLRRLFANSWFWTVLKTFVLACVYSLTIGIGFMLMAVGSILLA